MSPPSASSIETLNDYQAGAANLRRQSVAAGWEQNHAAAFRVKYMNFLDSMLILW
jgi:hypothetical protein